MSDNLEQKQAKMVEAELTSGRWISTMDQKGRTVYYNPTTKETTRDLRIFLLRQTGWDMLSSKHREVKDSSEVTSIGNNKKHKNIYGGPIDVITSEDQLKRELSDAKALIEAYESEVTWLRLALLEAEKKLDPGELAVAETSAKFFLKEPPKHHFQKRSGSVASAAASRSASMPAAADVSSPSSSTKQNQQQQQSSSNNSNTVCDDSGKTFTDYQQELHVLTQKLDESRKLNRKLLHRVSQDREQKHLCSRCLQDVDMITGNIGVSSTNNPSSLYNNQYSLTVPGGVGFPSTLSNPTTHDAIMLSRGLHELQVGGEGGQGVSHPAAVSGPVGYLPRGYDPMKLSLNGTTTGWESPSKRLLRDNNAHTNQPTALQQQQRSIGASALVAARQQPGGNNNNNNNNMSSSFFDPTTTSVAETPFHKNLEGLQLLRSSLEGDFPIDAHVRDPARNDFFKSSYFTASLKGKTAGSQSNNLSQQQQQQQQQMMMMRMNDATTGGLNQSQNSASQQQQQQHHHQQEQQPRKQFVNQPTPSMFYKSGMFGMSTF